MSQKLKVCEEFACDAPANEEYWHVNHRYCPFCGEKLTEVKY